MKLKLLDGNFAICRMDDNCVLPTWAVEGDAFMLSKIEGEISVVCEKRYVPYGILCEVDYCIIKIEEKLEFSMIGVLAELCEVMKTAEISILAMSTYDTDYILVKEEKVDKAVEFLQRAGYKFV